MIAPGQTLAKPAYGSPCNGCGLCCLLEQCPISEAMFGPMERCPALEAQDGGRWTCGLITDAGRYIGGKPAVVEIMSEAIGVMLGAGGGCDAVDGIEDQRLADAEGPLLVGKVLAAFKAARPEVQDCIRIFSGRIDL